MSRQLVSLTPAPLVHVPETILTLLQSVFAVACLLTDTTLIPRILLWFPREDPSTYRRGLMLVALPIAIKVLRVAFTM